MAEVTELQKLKDRLGISDNKQDANLKVLLEEAEDEALNYCNRNDVVEGMKSAIRKMAYLAYKSDGIENIASKSEGGRSVSYKDTNGIPSSVKSGLNRYRLGKVRKL
ncbi:phage head-tail connector protein [Vagococcus fluvialis]|uniref:phage head-tail connector protein n=1 Tax=Vagococcus fluvialis TaxID=2738 RepID=UPI0022E801EF|nr:phage head-tail connector protein [Vagococcus fluvialis]